MAISSYAHEYGMRLAQNAEPAASMRSHAHFGNAEHVVNVPAAARPLVRSKVRP